MSLISQSRLRRTANLNTRQPIAPVEVARFAGAVHDIPEAMSYIPPAQRPAVGNWGGFDLVFDLRCCAEFTVLGTRRGMTRRLIVLYDVWHTRADYDAGLPPVLSNSHEFGFGRRLSRDDIIATIRHHAREYVTRASLNGWTGDQRDPRLVDVVTDADDEGMLADARLIERVLEVDTATTNPSSAPLVTMEPK